MYEWGVCVRVSQAHGKKFQKRRSRNPWIRYEYVRRVSVCVGVRGGGVGMYVWGVCVCHCRDFVCVPHTQHVYVTNTGQGPQHQHSANRIYCLHGMYPLCIVCLCVSPALQGKDPNISTALKQDSITRGVKYSMATGNWGVGKAAAAGQVLGFELCCRV